MWPELMSVNILAPVAMSESSTSTLLFSSVAMLCGKNRVQGCVCTALPQISQPHKHTIACC